MRHLDHRAPKPRACEEALGAGVPLRPQEHDSWRTASFERRKRGLEQQYSAALGADALALVFAGLLSASAAL
jgi:hypothetical protein